MNLELLFVTSSKFSRKNSFYVLVPSLILLALSCCVGGFGIRSMQHHCNSRNILFLPTRVRFYSTNPLSSSSSIVRSNLLHDVHLRRIRNRHSSKLYSGAPNFKNEVTEKYFEFQRLESSIYSWWESSGYFKPDESNNDDTNDMTMTKKKKKPFVIPMPPPNVTGYLHMGHAIFVALQDIMARFHRMRGRPTLWLPGT
jgi:valyl-tRNA synthetase